MLKIYNYSLFFLEYYDTFSDDIDRECLSKMKTDFYISGAVPESVSINVNGLNIVFDNINQINSIDVSKLIPREITITDWADFSTKYPSLRWASYL